MVWASCCFSNWVLWSTSIRKGGEIIDTFSQHCYSGSSLSGNSINFSDLLLLFPCSALYTNNPMKGLPSEGRCRCYWLPDCVLYLSPSLTQSPFLSHINVTSFVETFTVNKDTLSFLFLHVNKYRLLFWCAFIFLERNCRAKVLLLFQRHFRKFYWIKVNQNELKQAI